MKVKQLLEAISTRRLAFELQQKLIQAGMEEVELKKCDQDAIEITFDFAPNETLYRHSELSIWSYLDEQECAVQLYMNRHRDAQHGVGLNISAIMIAIDKMSMHLIRRAIFT